MRTCRSAAILLLALSMPLGSGIQLGAEEPATSPAPGPFAVALPGGLPTWPNPDRWREEVVGDTGAVRLMGELGYARLTAAEELPDAETAMLRIEFHAGPRQMPFTAAVGEWGAPGIMVRPVQEGWQMAEVAFPMPRVRRHLRDGAVTVTFNATAGELAVARMELRVPNDDELMAAYRTYVKAGTEAAWRDSRKAEFTLVEEHRTANSFTPTMEEEQAGACVYFRNYLYPVYPASVPAAGERTATGEVVMARGEYEPYQFAVRALRDLPDCRAEIAGPLPPGMAAEICWVECVPLRTAGGSSSKLWHAQPNRLWPPEIFPACDVKKDHSQAWWIRLGANAKARPGVHPVPIRVTSAGATVAEFSLAVTVLPFTLPRIADHAFGFYTSLEVDDERILADLARHGCNSLSAWPTFVPVNRNKEVDFTAWDAYFATLRRHGLGHTFFWFIGTKETGDVVGKSLGDEALRAILKGIDERVAAKAYPRNFCVTIDEAVQNPAAFARMKELFAWMSAEVPALRRLGVSLDRHDYAAAHRGMIDVLSCNGSFGPNSAWCRANGPAMYTYTVFSGRTLAADSRYNCGFNPWRYSAAGTYGWALNWYNGDPFNDLDGWGSDWGIILPNWTGRPIATPAWEAFREGVDDRRYLMAYLRLAPGSPEEKERFLQGLRDDLVEEEASREQQVGDSIFRASVGEPDKLNQARKRIVDALLAARPATAGVP